ncbi:hypothetical protein HUG10_20065 (plasmid) [Halorarum halophilum]|uniref:Mandelate racemase/muconate lactonizing enzyme N-terminal domain-containing protein n=1 Tax=Halorarum halophilum TaxID=2743090 RepID=A0A7D5GEK8_9EURY|nr:hypothetical protein [Halobaculum halophilum]QLG29906.1 hypothetical protein HUG10_20065 [Halobaculum halophilum]
MADGLVGWGDASLGRRSKAVEAALEHHVLPELEGCDTSRIEDIWQSLFRHTYWRGGPVSSLSGFTPVSTRMGSTLVTFIG